MSGAPASPSANSVGDTQPSLLAAALGCRCPRCGKGRLFQGLLTVRPVCETCGLDLGAEDTGDGAAAFLILIIGSIAVALAFWVEFRFNPPLWVHAILWPAFVIPLTILLMRPLKAGLVAQQYRTRSSDTGL